MHASEGQNANLPEHQFAWEVSAAAALHLVPLSEKVPHMVVDMIVDRPVRLQPGAVAEVVRP